MTCSGAHKFLIDRGIVPTHHIDVDPRPHKVHLIGKPDERVEYLIASTCHPDLLESPRRVQRQALAHLRHVSRGAAAAAAWRMGADRRLFSRRADSSRWLAFIGFTDLHVFGMDGCVRRSKPRG
jgi:hypothetical protein